MPDAVLPHSASSQWQVLAYTGYDMEDAMILNKSSVERGFAHATLYKTEDINLKARAHWPCSAPANPVCVYIAMILWTFIH